MAADSSKFSVMVGLRRSRVLIRWACTWLRSLVVLHCWRIRVLGLCGNWGMVVMAVKGLAGEIGKAVNAILFNIGFFVKLLNGTLSL